jgi:hypothetical protein
MRIAMAKKKQMMLGEFEDKLKEHTVKKVLEEQDDLDYNTKRKNKRKQRNIQQWIRDKPPTRHTIATLATFEIGDTWLDTSTGNKYLCTDNQVNKLKWLLIQEGNQNNVHVIQQETAATIKLKRKDAYWSLPIVTNGNTHTTIVTNTQNTHTQTIIIQIEKHTCKIEVLETGEMLQAEYGNIIHL